MRGVEIRSIGRSVSVMPSIGKVAMTPRAQILAREFSPIRIPRMDPPKPQIRAADVIAEAERIITQVQAPSVIASDRRERGNLSSIRLLRRDAPRNDTVRTVVRFPEPQRGLYIRVIATETKSVPELKRVVVPAPVEEVVKVEEKEKEKEKPKAKRIEDATRLVIQLVEAVSVSRKRRLEIKAAIKEVKAGMEKSGLKAITGKIVAKLLSSSFWVHKSPIVGGGKDGTLPLTVYELLSDTREYRSEEEAEENLGQAVAKHIPVKSGEGGRLATIEEVMEVIEGNKRPISEDQYKAKLVVIKRVIAKSEVVSTGQTVNTLVEEKEEVRGEPTLKTLGLEELFPKAA